MWHERKSYRKKRKPWKIMEDLGKKIMELRSLELVEGMAERKDRRRETLTTNNIFNYPQAIIFLQGKANIDIKKIQIEICTQQSNM